VSAREDFRPGVYMHWKGSKYRALFLAQDSTNRADSGGSTEEPVVVYISLEGARAGNVCVRNLQQFMEHVEAGGPRFRWIAP